MGAAVKLNGWYLAAILTILLPSLASAECLSWYKCPYQPVPGEPNGRYLSPIFQHENIVGQGYMWHETTVGRETLNDGDLGGAIVCVEGPSPMPLVVANAFAAASCTPLANERAIEIELQRPLAIPFFDGVSFKFFDGQDGRELRLRERKLSGIKNRYDDSKIDNIVDRAQRGDIVGIGR